MYSVVTTGVIQGIDCIPVDVEIDISDGMPSFDMVGYLSAEVKESKERVRAALRNCGYILPVKRITVNMSPADIRKSGTGFDLPIAVGLCACMSLISPTIIEGAFIAGELSLDGSILPIKGVLPMVLEAKSKKARFCIVPSENYAEAKLVPDIDIYPANHLLQVIALLCETDKNGRDDFCRKNMLETINSKIHENENEKQPDFSEVNGQEFVKRACEVAVSGMHNLLMLGPPGSGKSLIAKCIPSILPPMTKSEKLELSKIYSVSGLLNASANGLINYRPYRSPHHTISESGLVGGGNGNDIRPGEVSLAHGGVLFLDEFLEFRRSTIEVLRGPMEDKVVTITRNKATATFPCDFLLLAAANPCKCGYFPNLNKCRCSKAQLDGYLSKMSQPILDRIDICVEAPSLDYTQITAKNKSETSAQIRERVMGAIDVQRRRYAGTKIGYNSKIPAAEIDTYCRLSPDDRRFMEKIYDELELSARTYHKILKVARTIADLSGERDIKREHLTEAVFYRSVDRKFWER